MNTNDLRVIKTKKNLEAALLRLLQKKNLEKIQVMHICKEAACSRNTFYAHYYNKYELFNDICVNLVEKICETFSIEYFNQEYVDLYGYGTEIIQVAEQYRTELSIILNSGYSKELKEQLRTKLYEITYISFLKKYNIKEIPQNIDLALLYQIGGVAEFVCNWISKNSKLTVNEASKLHSSINTPVVNAINNILASGIDMYVI